MSRACLITLVAFAAISCVAASRILEDDAAAMGRELLQAKADRSVCSKWCATNQCFRVGTTGLVRCNKCYNGMKPITSGVNAGQCGCPAGTYFQSGASASDATCVVCPFGSYCNKQLTWVPNSASGNVGVTECGTGLTTRARRSTSVWDCVNAGGWKLTNTATGPTAQQCLDDTYAIAKSKQIACTPCPSGMVVSNATDARDKPTACKVPKGYFMKSPGQIAPCDQGSYQDKFLGADQAAAGACTACEEGVTTADKGSEAAADCNKLKPGYVATDITTGITKAVLCPQGYYCPGSQSGDAAVTAVTITTLTTGDHIANDIYHAPLSIDPATVATAKISICPKNAWTKTVGATAVDQCMVPPGFVIDGTSISACTGNTYRSDWLALAAAAGKTCASCGSGILAEPVEPITLYSLNTTTEAGANTDYSVLSKLVQASSKSCYIVKGQGMYYVANGTSMIYKARNCGKGDSNLPNSYGVAGAKVYGLAQTPCKLCPAGMKADDALTNAQVASYETYKADNGFFNPLACVTNPGYGYDGRVATQCAKGWYNAGNNYLACQQCAYGLTTLTAGKTTSGDCKSAPGFGYYNGTSWLAQDGKMQQCPAGTYNNETRTPEECTACAGNSWTEEEGSDEPADCTICKPGFGGPNTGACVACGGNIAAGSYGPPGRDNTELACVACPTSDVGFQFWHNNTRYNYTSPARAVLGAQDAADCVAAMAQIEDGLWWLAGAEGDSSPTTKATVEECATTCAGDATCALATFDYANGSCKRLLIASDSGDVVTAFKAVPSSDVSQSRKLQAAKPKAVSTGMYTQWKYDGSAITGAATNTITDGVATEKAPCFEECDASDSCAGVVFDSAATGAKCKLIYGATDPADTVNTSKRSLTHAVPGRFAI